MKKSDSIVKISKALLLAQQEMGDAVKGASNPFFKSSYADLNSIREASIPVLNKQGIAVLQPTVYQDGKAFVETTLLHESGEFLASLTEIVCSKINDPQAHGSGVSYARRYGLQAFLNIGAVDDDAEGAMGRGKPAKAASAKTEVKAEAYSAPVSENATVTAASVEVPKKASTFRKPKANGAAAASTPVADDAQWD